jgi:hypothetical protein
MARVLLKLEASAFAGQLVSAMHNFISARVTQKQSRGAVVSGFRIKFTLQGGIGLFTSPPSESLELALRRAEDLVRRYSATIDRIVESEGYFFLDREGCAQLLRARSGR